MIYEVEVIYYTNYGVIKSRESDLFSNSQQAISCMKQKLSDTIFHSPEKFSDGFIELVDDNGVVRQSIKVGVL